MSSVNKNNNNNNNNNNNSNSNNNFSQSRLLTSIILDKIHICLICIECQAKQEEAWKTY